MKRPTTFPLLLLLCIYLTFAFARDAAQPQEHDQVEDNGEAPPPELAFARLSEAFQQLDMDWSELLAMSGDRPDKDHQMRDDVVEAVSMLEKVKPPPPSKLATLIRRPNGIFGSAVYYAKEAFVLLFMNGPKQTNLVTTSTQQTTPKLAQPLSKAVQILQHAANENDPDAIYLLAEMNFHGNYSHPVNYDEAFKRYKQLADLDGNSTAQYMVGFLYATGLPPSVPSNQAKSMLYHAFAAEQGNTRSQMTLGYRHLAGVATPRNCDEAVHWYKQVADKAVAYYRSGPPGGHSLIRDAYRVADEEGGVYGEGASVASAGQNAKQGGPTSDAYADVEDVLEYLHLQSSKGDLKATFGLARLHYDGARGLRKDPRVAKQYFLDIAREYWSQSGKVKKDVSQGTERLASKAAGYLGRMFLRGEGTKQDFAKAKIWFKRGVANGDALCQYSLGLMYMHGYGVEQDTVLASDFFAAAADQDLAVAQTNLGMIFLDQGDVSVAAKYFELAARNGHIEAFYYLAEMSEKGIGRDRSCGSAAVYYKIVVEKAEAIWSALGDAADAYEEGDHAASFIPYLMAAEQGSADAQANVAWLLDQAHAKPRWSPLNWLSRSTTNASNALGDAALALVHWTRSAKQQNIDALVKMGDYYLSGLGTAVSPENAASCYQAAAEPPGSAQAMWNLGWMHENGIGIEQDFHLAKRFYDQALETNDEAYLPVKLSLYKLRWRSWWNRVTGGSIHGIDEDMPAKKRRTFSEWLADFLEADAAMYYDGYEDDDLDGQEPMPGGDDYWEDGALDDDVMETLLIGGLIAALAWLVYYRGQRARAAEQRRRQAAENQQQSPPPPQQQQDPVPEHEDGQVPQRQQQDWGMFPPPDDPAFDAWAAGGVGH